MYKYVYKGPILEFDKCIANAWCGETMADSEKKARSNLAFQFKKETNRGPATRIKLSGKLNREKV